MDVGERESGARFEFLGVEIIWEVEPGEGGSSARAALPQLSSSGWEMAPHFRLRWGIAPTGSISGVFGLSQGARTTASLQSP